MITADHLTLRPEYSLRLAHGRAYIVRLRDDQLLAALTPPEAVLVGLLDGKRSSLATESLFGAAFGDATRPAVRYAIERLAPLLHEGEATRCDYPLNQLAAIAKPDPADGLRTLPGPRVLHWHVTQYCPRRCAYCYAEPIHGAQPNDAVVSAIRMRDLYVEAAELGATTLLVSGAEPFLRSDLPEVLGYAIQAGLTLLLTTKHPISAELAQRLASAGVVHLSLSLDSLEESENEWLVGSRAYAVQTLHSIKNLRNVGIDFSIQTVVTRQDPKSIEAIAQMAEREGAKVMQLVPFKDVRQPIAQLSNRELRIENPARFEALHEMIAGRHPQLRVGKFIESAGEGGFHCDIGQTKLLILPDGVVHRCYKLTEDDSLRGMDLKTVSLARGWHDPGFTDKVLPPARAYAETVCSSCSSQNSCDRSGRCIYDAFVNHGRYVAPDRECDGRKTLRKHPRIRMRAA